MPEVRVLNESGGRNVYNSRLNPATEGMQIIVGGSYCTESLSPAGTQLDSRRDLLHHCGANLIMSDFFEGNG
jgi:hypothetical protein